VRRPGEWSGWCQVASWRSLVWRLTNKTATARGGTAPGVAALSAVSTACRCRAAEAASEQRCRDMGKEVGEISFAAC
jgi:hypothetical protein